jgi:hypothetical protein
LRIKKIAVAQQPLEQREGNADHLAVEVRMAGIAPHQVDALTADRLVVERREVILPV